MRGRQKGQRRRENGSRGEEGARNGKGRGGEGGELKQSLILAGIRECLVIFMTWTRFIFCSHINMEWSSSALIHPSCRVPLSDVAIL